jgi:enoyl-CoA hydratase/carnithine racemase
MSDLLFTVENGIARITLNRPDNLNALSNEMIELWIDALKTVRDSDDIRVLVITGNGRAFCAGGDVRAMEEDFSKNALGRKNTIWKGVQRVPMLLEQIDIPVIAVINGHAMGAGLDMALACDIRIAAQSAKMAESYVRVGIVPGDGGAYFLPRLVGVDKALELLWTGEILTAEQAHQLGLVTHVVPDEELHSFVEKYVEKLASGPLETVKFTKRAVYQGLKTDLRTSLDYISSAMGIVTELDDFHERIKAIAEKIKPRKE